MIQRVKVKVILCLVAAAFVAGLWMASYKAVIGIRVPFRERQFCVSSFNGNINLWQQDRNERLNQWMDGKYGSPDWYYQRKVDLDSPNSAAAKAAIKSGRTHGVRRIFGKPALESRDGVLISAHIPHWIVALIFVLIGTLWQNLGKRSDTSAERD